MDLTHSLSKSIDANAAVEDGRITETIQKEIQRAHENQLPPPMLTGMGGIFWCMVHTKGEPISSNVRYLYTDGCVGMSNDDMTSCEIIWMKSQR